VLLLYGLCCLFALTALAMAYANSAQGAMLLMGVGLIVFVLIRKLGYLSRQEMTMAQEVRRRNTQLRSIVKQVNGDLAKAQTVEQIWESVRPLAEALNASSLEMRLKRRGGDLEDTVRFETQRSAGSALPLEIALEIAANEQKFGKLTLAWRDGRGEVNRDEELALELVADSIAKATRDVISQGVARSPLPATKRLESRRMN